jgi:hypothetical protein
MVCNCCLLAVKQELERHGLQPEKVSLGEVILREDNGFSFVIFKAVPFSNQALTLS